MEHELAVNVMAPFGLKSVCGVIDHGSVMRIWPCRLPTSRPKLQSHNVRIRTPANPKIGNTRDIPMQIPISARALFFFTKQDIVKKVVLIGPGYDGNGPRILTTKEFWSRMIGFTKYIPEFYFYQDA